MNAAVSKSVFSVPLMSGGFPGAIGQGIWDEIALMGSTTFVGDQPNQMLKYLLSDQFPRPSDWPVVLYGSNGTGKTSLAMTFAATLAENIEIRDEPFETEPVVFLTAVDFCRRFRSACETNSIADFRNSFVQARCVVLDDAQKLAGKQFEQIELIHILGLLSEKEIPVLITCNDIPARCGLVAPLSSRITSGLCLAVNPPGLAARIEIVRDLALKYGLQIKEGAIEWLAEKLPVTAPKLNHFLAQIKTQTAPESIGELDVDDLKRLFAASSQTHTAALSKKIVSSVAEEFFLKPADLTGNSRKQTIVAARSVAIYFCRRLLDISFLKIGKIFGGRDHSTVMHANQKIEALVADKSNPALCEKINRLNQSLANQMTV